MFDYIVKYAEIFLANWQRALWGGIMSVSAVIVVMGVLKKWIKKLIPEGKLRKFVLAFGSIALVFPATAGVFALESINFNHYWLGVALNSIATIVGYWAYEYTCFRNFIHYVGENTLGRLWNAFVTALKHSKQAKIIANEKLLPVAKEKQETTAKKVVNYKDLSNL